MKQHEYEISAFYFPNFHHGDRHNEDWHGKGWTEWEVLKKATPRFPGHDMPKVPLWGYEDEAEIPVMEKKIAAAAKYGVTNLLFDWYWYEDGPFLNKPLDEAFLKAKNKNDVSFSLMWANHNWLDIHPIAKAYMGRQRVELDGVISEKAFYEAIDYIIKHYFSQENYFRLDGKLYFSFYEIKNFIAVFGSIERAKEALAEIRRRVAAAGLGEVHFNAVSWGIRILQGESAGRVDGDALREMGFDSVMTYVWIHEHEIPAFPSSTYAEFREICAGDFERLTETFRGITYYPNVTCGWDSSPRTCQSDIYGDYGYPFSRILTDNTPEEFEKALRRVKETLDKSNLKTKMFTVNAWNEWTEGSYLEPDTKEGFGKLEAIKRVFGENSKK